MVKDMTDKLLDGTTKDRFDFEQDIFECWHVVSDIKQLYEMASDSSVSNRGVSKEDIANILLGLHTMYEDRFHRLMDTFEHLINDGGFAKSESEYTPKYEKLYTELLTKLRIISETDKIRSAIPPALDE